MKTKQIYLMLSAMFLLFIPISMQASHVVGSYITYQYMGPNQYLVTFKLYRDCDGVSAPATIIICYESTSAGLSDTVNLNLIPGTGNEIPPYPCYISGTTTCQGGSTFGVQEWIYQGVVTLPLAAIDWVFGWNQCCRSANITTLTGAGGVGHYVFAKLDNLTYPVNSSPQFSTSSFAQFCINTLSNYSLPCTDSDGDSIAYFLTAPEDGLSGCPIGHYAAIYNPPYSPTNPISSSTPITFDPATGTLTFTPDLFQAGVFCMVVKEYRNGVLIGEVKRDDMVFITNGVINPNWMKGKVFLDQNGNSAYDAGEPGKQGTILEVQPGTFYASTNYYGDYAIPLSPGFYITTIPNLPLYYTSTPLSNSATFTGTFQTDSMNDFAITSIPNVQNLSVSLTGNNAVPGTSTYMQLTYTNIGTVTMSGSVNLIYDSDLTYTSSTPTPDNISGDTLTWIFSNLVPLDAENIYLTFFLPASVTAGTPLNSSAEILPVTGDTFPQDNYDGIDCEVVASCDPNEKRVEPAGPITTTQVANGQYLEYTIFFQNTGTAPAIIVIITDTLDPDFNIPTFEVLSASHSYTWDITGPGIIEFTFDNIMLPDSGTNELLSHGFIKYRIKAKNNLVQGDKLTNTAYIVFDSNAPLATNSVSTTVINPVSVSELSPGISDLIIYPNPSNNFLNIEMNLKEAVSLDIQLFNLTGETVKESKSTAPAGSFKKQWRVHDLSSGLYFLKITTAKGISVVKIMRN